MVCFRKIRFGSADDLFRRRQLEVVPAQALKHRPNGRHVRGRVGIEDDKVVHVRPETGQTFNRLVDDFSEPPGRGGAPWAVAGTQ